MGLGAAHGFKFVPTFGRLLADLVTTGETATDVSAFRLDRPALTEPDYAAALAGVTWRSVQTSRRRCPARTASWPATQLAAACG